MSKKIIALFIAALITIGTGSYGTYAYLQSSKDVTDNVNITMGTLEVSSYWDSEWTATNESTESVKTGNGLSFKNVKPGDTFTRVICITNRGTLKAVVEATVNSEIGNGIDVDIVAATANKWSAQPDAISSNTVGKTLSVKNSDGGHYMYVTVQVTITDEIFENTDLLSNVFSAEAATFLDVQSSQIGSEAE